ncbi:MAG: hypothetical protein ACYTG5_04595 [Planctomycetota bacterium]
MESQPENPGSNARKLDWGILGFLGCLLIIPFLIWYLIANWQAGEGSETTPRPPQETITPAAESESRREDSSSRRDARRIARENGHRNARDYRRHLKRELDAAEAELLDTRRQARLDPQPEMAEHWRTLLAEKLEIREDAARRLAEFDALMK